MMGKERRGEIKKGRKMDKAGGKKKDQVYMKPVVSKDRNGTEPRT